MANFIWPNPTQSVTATNPSVSATGAPVPASGTLSAGKDGSGNLRPLLTDTTGALSVNVLSGGGGGGSNASVSTTGTAVPTSATLIGGTNGTNLIGVKVSAAGVVSVDGSGVTQPVSVSNFPATQAVSAASLPLPTGAATSALQTTGNTSLGSIDTKLPTLVTGRIPVDGSGVTQPVSAASLPLPTGAATETTLSAMSAKLPTALGTKTSANSISVVLASDQAVQFVNLRDGSGATVSKGQSTMSGSLPVAIASDQTFASPKGRTIVNTVYLDYSSTNVGPTSWVQLLATTSAASNFITIDDTGGYFMEVGTGAAASETRLLVSSPGGAGPCPVVIASSTRISIRCLESGTTVSSGKIAINFYS